MAIPEHVKKNFDTLKRAFTDGNIALMECTRKKNGKPVFVICAAQPVRDEPESDDVELVPFAEMAGGNPYDIYEPPIPRKDRP